MGDLDRSQIQPLTEHRRPVRVLDGAMGTELQRLGFELPAPLWSAGPLLDAPDVVVRVHESYLERGADIVTANTFRTNVRSFEAAGKTKPEALAATRLAVDCARKAIERTRTASRVAIAGSVAPVCDCYSPELVPDEQALGLEHRQLVEWLLEAGVDIILVECMNTIREAQIVVRAARELDAVVWAAFVCGDAPDRLLSGEALRDGVRAVDREGANAIGVNCVPATSMAQSLRIVRASTERLVIGYANGGVAGPSDVWAPDPTLRGERFAALCREWIATGAAILGGCCGTQPEHIEILSRIVDKLDIDA